MAKEVPSSDLLTTTQMADRIFHTKNTQRVHQVHAVAEKLAKQKWLQVPGVGHVAAHLMIDYCPAAGSSEPVIYMDERLEPLVKQELGFLEFIPLRKYNFISERTLHDKIGRSTNLVIRTAQRQAIHEALGRLGQKEILDLHDEYGNLDRMRKEECLLYGRRGRIVGYYFDPRLANDPELSEEAIAKRVAEIRGEKSKDTGRQYADHRMRQWLSPSSIARKLETEFRTPKGRAAITKQLKEHYANEHPGVGKFANPGSTEGVYRLNPRYMGIIDEDRLRRDIATSLPAPPEMDEKQR